MRCAGAQTSRCSSVAVAPATYSGGSLNLSASSSFSSMGAGGQGVVPMPPIMAVPTVGPARPLAFGTPSQSFPPQPARSPGLQAPKGLSVQPLQLPKLTPVLDLLESQQTVARVQAELAAKDEQLENLTRYNNSLQQIVQREAVLPAIQEEVSLAKSDCSALALELAKAAEVASRLHAWFLENAEPLNLQEEGSPSAYLEEMTRELRKQSQVLGACLTCVQGALDGEVSGPAAPRPPQPTAWQ